MSLSINTNPTELPTPPIHLPIDEAAAERFSDRLAALIDGGVVGYAPETQTFRLPPEHAACLTRDGRLGNLAVYAQFIALMGQVQEQTLEYFETGAGLCYHDYPDLHRVMPEDRDQTVVAQLFSELLPLGPGLPARLEAGIDVLDAGCGRGKALIAMARRFPRSRFTGYDLCADAIVDARAAAAAEGLGNIRFDARDLDRFDERDRDDFLVSFDAVHDQLGRRR